MQRRVQVRFGSSNVEIVISDGQIEVKCSADSWVEEQPLAVVWMIHFKDLDAKDILDINACVECGRCTQFCPANLAGETLNPKEVILDLQRGALSGGDIVAGTPEEKAEKKVYVSEEDLFQCLSCGAIVLSASAFATTDDKKPKSIKCAVMNGKDVDIKAATEAKMFSDYKGNRYFFCCGGCPEAFKKDPAKFSKSAHIKTPKAPKKA